MDGSHGEQINREFIVEHSGTTMFFHEVKSGKLELWTEATIDFDFSF